MKGAEGPTWAVIRMGCGGWGSGAAGCAPACVSPGTTKQAYARPTSSPACLPQSYLGQALPAHMVARLYDGMRGVDPARKAQVPSESVSREQFVLAMSHLLKGDATERSALILKMISKTGGPVRAHEVQRVGRGCKTLTGFPGEG